MREPMRRQARMDTDAEVIPFDEMLMAREIRELVAAVKENTLVVTELSQAATSTLAFFKRWTGWVVAAIAIAYPTIGQIISGLPPLPG